MEAPFNSHRDSNSPWERTSSGFLCRRLYRSSFCCSAASGPTWSRRPRAPDAGPSSKTKKKQIMKWLVEQLWLRCRVSEFKAYSPSIFSLMRPWESPSWQCNMPRYQWYPSLTAFGKASLISSEWIKFATKCTPLANPLGQGSHV